MIDVDKVVAEAKKRRPWRVAGQMYRSFVPPVPGSFEWADIGEYVHVQHFDNLIAAIEQLQAELETVRRDEREKAYREINALYNREGTNWADYRTSKFLRAINALKMEGSDEIL